MSSINAESGIEPLCQSPIPLGIEHPPPGFFPPESGGQGYESITSGPLEAILTGPVDMNRRYLVQKTIYTGLDHIPGSGIYADTSGTLTRTRTMDADTGEVEDVWDGEISSHYHSDGEGDAVDVTRTFDGTVYTHTPDPYPPFFDESVMGFTFNTTVAASGISKWKYQWAVCPAAYVYFKFWWQEKTVPANGDAGVFTNRSLTMTPAHHAGTCIPEGCDLRHSPLGVTDDNNWPRTAWYFSDDPIEIVNIRYSGREGYEPTAGEPDAFPPVAAGRNGFP